MPLPNIIAEPRRASVFAVIAMLFGIVLLSYGVARNMKHQPLLVRVDIPAEPGAIIQSDFELASSEQYEVEVEFRWDQLPDDWRQDVRLRGDNSPVDLDWWVRDADDQVVAQGGTRDFLYIQPWVGKKDRYLNRLFRRDDHRWPDGPTAGRGVGSFKGAKGERYRVGATIGDMPDVLFAAEPQLCVRLNRVFWQRYRATSDRWIAAGCAFMLAGSLLLVMAWGNRLISRSK